MASTASANTLWPYGLQSTRVFGVAGLTMAKVGKADPVSTSSATPGTSQTAPSSSKHTVRMR